MCCHLVQCLLHYSFTFIVQGWGGHVQQEDFGVSDQCSSDCNPLLLPTTHLTSTLSNKCIKILYYGISMSWKTCYISYLLATKIKSIVQQIIIYYCKAEVCMVYKVSVLHIKNYDSLFIYFFCTLTAILLIRAFFCVVGSVPVAGPW